MKKLFAQVLILLFIALVSGYSKLYATTRSMTQNIAFDQTQLNSNKVEQKCETLESYLKTALTPSEKPAEKIDPTDTEDEEDEFSTYKSLLFKKLAGTSSLYITAASYNVPQSYYHTVSQQKRLQLCRHFLYIPAGKWYICFNVFRI